MKPQRGGFAMGLVAGLLVGLALALAVALYITRAPVPFIDKVPQRTAEQDSAEIERNRNWDPNAPLGGKPVVRPADPVASAPMPGPDAGAAVTPSASAPAVAGKPTVRDPAAILAGTAPPLPPVAASAPKGADAFDYFVQAGAFTRAEDAEQQRARLAMLGQTARITEREQAGRTVYRVRIGPYPARGEADGLQLKLQEQSIESQIVRVERP